MTSKKPTDKGQKRPGHSGREGGERRAKSGETPRTSEVPGRPEADREPRREKAYGPGGAAPEDSGSSRAVDATPVDEPATIDNPPLPGEPPGAGRTAEGADTKPL